MLPDLTTKTLAQLQAQLVPTKRAALIAINGSDRVSNVATISRKDGQVESQTEAVRDVETDALILTRTITWTYYEKEKGAPVDTITIVETDGAGKETKRMTIKHFTDGKQPEVNYGIK